MVMRPRTVEDEILNNARFFDGYGSDFVDGGIGVNDIDLADPSKGASFTAVNDTVHHRGHAIGFGAPPKRDMISNLGSKDRILCRAATSRWPRRFLPVTCEATWVFIEQHHKSDLGEADFLIV